MECSGLIVTQAASDSSFFNCGHRLSPHKVNYCCHRDLSAIFSNSNTNSWKKNYILTLKDMPSALIIISLSVQ